MLMKRVLQMLAAGCLCLSVSAAAAQKPVVIPMDYAYKEIQADFSASGPTLLFSDSPEMVYSNGILYRDRVQGDVRIFLHHVNAVAAPKKLAIVLHNDKELRPVEYQVSRRGVGTVSYNYLLDGKLAEQEYFAPQQQEQAGTLGFGRTVELLSGRGVVLNPNKLLTGIIDLHFSRPAEVSVLMCEPQSDIELFNEDGQILPMDEHPLRGTFAKSDWQYTLKRPVQNLREPLMLKLAGAEEGYAKGVDATTGLPAENYGNYGIVYRVNFAVGGNEPVSLIFNPIGGLFAGQGILENKTTGERQNINLPGSATAFGETMEEAEEVAVLSAGEYSFIWSPPGAGNLPVRLFWRPAAAGAQSVTK